MLSLTTKGCVYASHPILGLCVLKMYSVEGTYFSTTSKYISVVDAIITEGKSAMAQAEKTLVEASEKNHCSRC